MSIYCGVHGDPDIVIVGGEPLPDVIVGVEALRPEEAWTPDLTENAENSSLSFERVPLMDLLERDLDEGSFSISSLSVRVRSL